MQNGIATSDDERDVISSKKLKLEQMKKKWKNKIRLTPSTRSADSKRKTSKTKNEIKAEKSKAKRRKLG
jgi:hypothetical protein